MAITRFLSRLGPGQSVSRIARSRLSIVELVMRLPSVVRFACWVIALSAAALAGCSKPGLQLVKVDGTLKYADGKVPRGEVRVVRFEPTPAADGAVSSRPATADVQEDGTFRASTIKPGDGALPGDYKVVLAFFKSYVKHDPALPDIYSSAATTPLKCTVKPGEANHLELVVEKRR